MSRDTYSVRCDCCGAESDFSTSREANDEVHRIRLAHRGVKERDLEWAQWLAGRIAEGKCALVGGWCVIHNTEDNPGHSFDKGGLSTLD